MNSEFLITQQLKESVSAKLKNFDPTNAAYRDQILPSRTLLGIIDYVIKVQLTKAGSDQTPELKEFRQQLLYQAAGLLILWLQETEKRTISHDEFNMIFENNNYELVRLALEAFYNRKINESQETDLQLIDSEPDNWRQVIQNDQSLKQLFVNQSQ